LARDRVEVEAGLEPADLTEVERQEVEEQGPLGLGRQRDHLALRLGLRDLVDPLEVGRLSAQAGPVVDDLEVDLPCAVVDERHGWPATLPRRPALQLLRSSVRTCLASALRVSNTPSPVTAEASKSGTPLVLSVRRSSSSGTALGRSRRSY